MKTNSTPLLCLKVKFAHLLVALFTLTCLSSVQSQHRVQYYYLYTNEFSPSQEEMDSVTAAMFDVQAWYQVATGGLTFIIDNPNAPIVMALQQNSAFYSSDFVGKIYTEIYTNGPLEEEGDVDKIFFVKGGGGMAAGANACNNTGGTAWIGMDIFPEFNTGQYFDCPPGNGGAAWPCTPHGAIAHELGHTFSLPHPFPTYPENVAFHSVMQSHWFYPYIWATPAETPWSMLSVEREAIQACPFLVNTDILVPQPYEALPVCNLPANGPTPNADFSYSTNGTEVSFTNQSSGEVLTYWTFGNGNVSTEADPVFDFEEDGIYEVRLRATGSNGMMDMAQMQVVLCNSMITSINASEEEICAGEDVSITATGGSTYLWNTGATTPTIVTDPFEDFEYEVTITASNGCWTTESIYITVFETPDVEISSTANNDAICLGESVDLEVGSFEEYIWNTGDTDYIINVSPESTTSYSVTVTSNEGCSASDDIVIQVFPQPVANITASVSQICPGDTAVLTASGGTTFLWSTGQTLAQILVVPDSTTTYGVTASTGGDCADNHTIDITVWPQAIASLTAPTHACQGDTAILTGSGNGAWIWSTGDTTSQIQPSILTDTSFTLTVTTVNGCSADATASISIHTLSSTVLEMSDDSLCSGSVVELTAPVAAQYQWSTGDTTATIQYVVHDTVQVQLTAIDSNQCTFGFASAFYVFPSPLIDITGPPGLCLGDTQVLTVPQDFVSYAWSTGSDTSFSVVTSAGLVSVDVVDAFGCMQSDTTVLLQDDTEGLTILVPSHICEGDTAILEATPGLFQYAWSSGQDTNVVVTTVSGLYTLTVTGQFGCTNSDTVILTLFPLPQFELMLIGSDLVPAGLPAEPLTYLWSDGSTANALTVSASGLYCLTVTSETGCIYSSCLEVVINAGETLSPASVLLYPNPFTNEILLEGDFTDKDEVVISNLIGRLKNAEITRTEKGIRIAETGLWPSGIYYLQVLRNKQHLVTLRAVKI